MVSVLAIHVYVKFQLCKKTIKMIVVAILVITKLVCVLFSQKP
jgi:hypothetical protein